MPLKFALLLLGFFACLVATEHSPKNAKGAAVKDLLDRILGDGYNPDYPPEGNKGHGSPVEVYIRVFLINIFKIYTHNMEFSAQFYFSRRWNDSRLQYHHKDIKLIRINKTDKIWIPDLYFEEEIQGHEHAIATPNFFLTIEPTGEVLYSSKLSVTFGCPMDLSKFPHCRHKCNFTISSYGYDTTRFILAWQEGQPLVVEKVPDLNFDLLEATHHVLNTSFSFANYTSLQVSLNFQRKPGFFLRRLFVPYIILVLISWLSFWMKAHQVVLRLTFLLTILFIMFSISSDINWYVPAVSYTKGSDVWIACSQSLVFGAMLEFILISYLKTNSSAKGNIGLESEKDSASKTENMDSSARVMAQNILKLRLPERVDMISRVLFPFLFILLNIVYWSVYCAGN